MKTRNFQSSLLAIATVTALAFTAGTVAAQDSTAVTAPPAAANQPAPQLSYGVPQVLQLVQAKVSDSVIVSYIQNSGTIYSLKAGEIVYLKQLGVSDDVLNAMLTQRSRVTGSTEPSTPTASSPATSAPAASAPAASDQTYSATAPSVTYVQQAAQPSTVYVMPNTQPYYYSYPYYSYPYYGGYYSGWPAISLSFGWGSYNYSGGGYHGGYYGGWHGGGGYHGGGGGGWHGGGGGGWHH